MGWALWILVFLHLTLAAFTSVWVICERRSPPQATWGWICSTFLFPVLGVLAFWVAGYRHFRRSKRVRALPRGVIGDGASEFQTTKRCKAPGESSVGIQALCTSLTGYPPRSENSIELFLDGNRTLAAISESIRRAKKHVFIEYFIYEPDGTGDYISQLLISKAREGVRCHLLIDDVGSYRFGRRSTALLEQHGVQVARFGKLRMRRPWFAHLRNHRKIVIVDGAEGYCGSQNVSNDYLRWRQRDRQWSDVQLKIRGAAVGDLQSIFRKDWYAATGIDLPPDNHDELRPQAMAPSSEVQIFPTGPEEGRYGFEQLITSLLAAAKQRVTIRSPYFVPTLPLVIAIAAAVNRGVKVDILIPRRSDHRLVDLAARGWFPELLRAGAKIDLLPKRFPHEKVITIDEKLALVGSGNMDQRSFRLNYECGVLLYDPGRVRELLERFETNFSQDSITVTDDDLCKDGLTRKFLSGLGKALSPVL